jgi:hypothetical protein
VTLTSPRALVILTATITAPGNSSSTAAQAFMGVSIEGGTASDTQAVMVGTTSCGTFCSTVNASGTTSATFYVSTLSAGTHTFVAKYRATGGTATFANRTVTVIPLP